MPPDPAPLPVFHHEALLYRGLEEFVAETVSFVDDGLRADQPVLVAVSQPKIGLLREALGGRSDRVVFADMAELGRNPARLIPAWRRFAEEHAANPAGLRGVGEPIWPQRSAAELAESQRHEALVNLAFAGAPQLRLLCPYDLDALDGAVIDEARHSHPFVRAAGASSASPGFAGSGRAAPYDRPLAEPPAPSPPFEFDADSLGELRDLVHARGVAAMLREPHLSDLVLAVGEIAANSVRHGGGRGVLRTWTPPGELVCEIRDRGHIADPLAGRREPPADAVGGRGLWIANQLCDLVEVRSSTEGSTIRLHVRT